MNKKRAIRLALPVVLFSPAPFARAVLVSGTTGDDLMFFNNNTPTIQTVTTTITNPYTGESIPINGSYNANIDTYDGLAGNDELAGTNVAEFFTLRNASNQKTMVNIEGLVFGSGDDVINMADGTFTLPGIFIDLGLNNDIAWGNIGNDTIQGQAGNDTINGGPGNDSLLGQADDDVFVFGLGMGHDTISGGAGNNEIDFAAGITAADLHYTGNGTGTTMEFNVGNGGDHISVNNVTNDMVQLFRFSNGSTIDPQTIPEPATLALLVPLIFLKRRRHT